MRLPSAGCGAAGAAAAATEKPAAAHAAAAAGGSGAASTQQQGGAAPPTLVQQQLPQGCDPGQAVLACLGGADTQAVPHLPEGQALL